MTPIMSLDTLLRFFFFGGPFLCRFLFRFLALKSWPLVGKFFSVNHEAAPPTLCLPNFFFEISLCGKSIEILMFFFPSRS